jgi:hypothetical protein
VTQRVYALLWGHNYSPRVGALGVSLKTALDWPLARLNATMFPQS